MRKFSLVLLAVALAFGMAVVGCDDEINPDFDGRWVAENGNSLFFEEYGFVTFSQASSPTSSRYSYNYTATTIEIGLVYNYNLTNTYLELTKIQGHFYQSDLDYSGIYYKQ